jgi:hypothetical protein
MKTSNKLISGLLAVIFILMTVFMIMLRNKIKAGADMEKVNTEWINGK